ncbi:MAG: hypothetical protein V1804_02940 [Patescibacteria group bacterium]
MIKLKFMIFGNKKKIFLFLSFALFLLAVPLFFQQLLSKKEADANTLFNNPQKTFLTNYGAYIYVFNSGNKTITKIRTSDSKEMLKIKFDPEPTTVFYTSQFQKIYAPSFIDGNVSILKLPGDASGTKTISLGKMMHLKFRSFLFDAENKKLFVLAENYEESPNGAVLVIDLEKDSISNVIKLDSSIRADFSSLSNGKLFVYDPLKNEFFVIDCGKEEVNKKIQLESDVKVEDSVISKQGKVIYFLAGGNLVALDAESGNIISKLKVKSGVKKIRADENSELVYVVSSSEDETNGFLTMAVPNENRIISEVEVGNNPINLFIGKNYVYVLNNGSNSISVFDKKTNRVVGTISSGGLNPIYMNIDESKDIMYISNFANNTIGIVDLNTQKLVGIIPEKENIFKQYWLFIALFLSAIISLVLFFFLSSRTSGDSAYQG